MTEQQADWPYDAERGEWAERYRLPVVGTMNPRWTYHVALCVGDLYRGVRPSEAEAAALAVGLEYVLRWYRPGYRKQMLDEAPFDLDGGTNTVTFLKRANGGWAYTKRTFTGGNVYPAWDAEPVSLARLLDVVFGNSRFDGTDDGFPNRRWEEVKAEYAEVLAAPEVVEVRPPCICSLGVTNCTIHNPTEVPAP